jgi:hypothetical protein
MENSSLLRAGLRSNLLSPLNFLVNKKTSPPPAPEATPPGQSSGPYPWILNPSIDLMLCCGGAFWLFFLIFRLGHFSTFLGSTNGGPASLGLMALAVFGLHFFGDSHFPATVFRVYGSPSTRAALGKPGAIIILLAIGISLLAFTVPGLIIPIAKFNLLWAIQHQLAQAYGISLLYCYKRKYYLNDKEKFVMQGLVYASMAFLGIRTLAFKDFGQYSLAGLDVPFWNLVPPWAVTVTVAVQIAFAIAFAIVVARKYQRDRVMFPFPALMTLSTLMLMPLAAGNSFLVVWYVISSVWFHSSQYLCVTAAYYLKERGLPEGVSYSDIGRLLWSRISGMYFGVLFLIGFSICYLLPCWLATRGIPAGLAFAGVVVGLNFQHFLTDALIWKMRDPAVKKLLVS